MRKKILAATAALLLLAGCGTAADFDASRYSIAESGTWADGPYTQEAAGKNGSFAVTVTISDGVMTDIEIGSNTETADKGGVAIAKLPGEMLERQSAAVDAVSGATVTSDALRDAVARCLEKASADAEK